MTQKLTPCLWFGNSAEEAALFYAALFGSPAPRVNRMPDGNVMMAIVNILGTDFTLLNGNNRSVPNDSISFSIDCKDQAEVDKYWNAFVADGGEESMCGWCKDRFGISWQVIPEALPRAMTSSDPGVAQRAAAAMMKMRKIIVADIEAAVAG
jgi:predicted 3-demethylubiquinone-9 3-methyltransferase (glyoxalase superfamily)